MCWQHISMKDPMSQELLEAVEQERNIRANPSRNTVVFHHPMLGDFEIPVGADDAELEERIIQHLAAAAAVRRSHRHHNRRDGHQSRSGASSHPHFLVLSADERTISGQEGDYEQAPAVASGRPLRTLVEQERTRGLGSKVAMFQYSSVEIYNACKPQPTLEIHNPDMHKDAPRGASSSAAQRLTVDAGLPVLPGLDDILDVPEGLDGQGNDISSWFTDGLDDSLQDIDLSGALEIPDDDLTQLGF
ncbi:E3 ubiquitin-protein ligase RHF2A, partial [Zea mays]